MLTDYSQNHWAIPENTNANVRLLWGWGQGTLGLIKVGRFVIQARLKSTGVQVSGSSAATSWGRMPCGSGDAQMERYAHVYAGAGQALHNETSCSHL